jgi:HAD superfamily hydrolase (TIGR01509 family)
MVTVGPRRWVVPSPRAVLLDLDRTLVDVESHVDYAAAVQDLAAEALLEAAPDATGDTSWGSATLQAMDALVALAGDARWTDASDMVARHELLGAAEATPMPGLESFLAGLAGRPTAVVTLLSEAATRHVLEAHWIAVDVVVPRRPDLRPKPAPDQVVAALEALGVPARDAVMVGDSERDEAAAHAAGVRFVGLTNGRRGSRFGAGTLVVDDLLAAGAVLVDRG